ncbi:unnamed protein product [Gongylonema pulchrum]|uniref:Uncharacterized protein n=1 Tax=Gongylonema pulchrum TaxID=637853 RepID=A0A3P6SLH2_9BILA|nr:unnamed protein product [Gongylonema pulchrum]
MYCRNGQSNVPETRILSLCPSSTTSCGYFEFQTLSSPGNADEPLAIYECVDSSVLMSDNDDHENEKQVFAVGLFLYESLSIFVFFCRILWEENVLVCL